MFSRLSFPRLITTRIQIRTMASNDKAASMIGGHAQYAKGYVSETIGNVTGSADWQESGKADQKEGIDSMKVS